MPSLKRGFLFTYFDKIICGVVGLGLLLGIVYALSRFGPLSAEIASQNVRENVVIIEGMLRRPPETLSVDLPDLLTLAQVTAPPAVRPGIFIWPLPVEYPPVKVGLNKEFVLQFKAPLGEGTLSVQRNEPLLGIVQHPVDGDYSKVKVRSKSWEGEAAVVGYEGDRAHIYTVIVDSGVNKTAYPPTIQVADRQGVARLRLVEDDRIADEGVDILYYEIWRRDWRDPLGEYELINEVDLSGKALRAAAPVRPGRRAAAPPRARPASAPTSTRSRYAAPAWARRGGVPPGVMPGQVPMVPTRTTTTAQPGQAGILWQDDQVEPGQHYSYKARGVGANTFPTEGEYCESVMVEVLPDIDFRFTLTSRDTVRFEVVKAVGLQSAQKENFWVGVGGEIGGLYTERSTGAVQSYLTGNMLVDFHPVAVEPQRPGLSARVVYADNNGNLHVLWRNEMKATPLWEREKAATPARGAATPYGAYGAARPTGYR